MSRNYKFHNLEGAYFVSFAVVNWLDVFTRKEYIEIILDSLRYCQKEKGMEIYAWCIMTNHIHLVFKSINGQKPGLLLGDFKKFTSKAIVNAIIDNPNEQNRTHFLESFIKAGKKSSNVKTYQFWQHHNQPIEIWSNKIISQKIRYVHNNPVAAGYVNKPEEYLYSSARDYCDEVGLISDVVLLDIV